MGRIEGGDHSRALSKSSILNRANVILSYGLFFPRSYRQTVSPLGRIARLEYALGPSCNWSCMGHDLPSLKLARTVMFRRLSTLAGLENKIIFFPLLSGHEYLRILAWQTGSINVESKPWPAQVSPPS